MAFSFGGSDVSFRMMQRSDAQMSTMRTVGPDSNFSALAKSDKNFAIQQQQDELQYIMLEKMEDMHDKFEKDKIERDFSTFSD